MTEVFGRVYNDVADESLEDLRADIETRATEKYAISINTDETYG